MTAPRPAVGEPRPRPRRCGRTGDSAVAEADPQVRAQGARGAARKRRRGPFPPPCSPARSSPTSSGQVYFVRNSPRRALQRSTGSPRPAWNGPAPRGGHWFAEAGELAPGRGAQPPPPPGCPLITAPRHPPARGPGPSPCSEAPSGGGSSSSDLRCWGLACLRRDMLLAARGPRAGQRHQRGGRRGRRGAAGRARGAGRGRRRLRGPRMGLSN